MAAETRHAGLTADERSTIRSTVLKARETIENDLYRQLERYGIYDDERVDIDALGHLDAYDKQTRSQIDAALDRELEATDDDYERSVKNYVREATKTYLNRLVALKTIEVRGLVTETMIKRPEYGNRSEMHRTIDEVAGELTDQSDSGLRVAVELAFTELTDEISVIFEESEYTAIDLDFTVRERIIEQLNAIDESVWESDEAMGWVYQYFGENEREDIDDRIDEENYKIQDTDVATKTQLFTPRYIVEWMVDNSLGRLWLEMNGAETDINDEDNCFYLTPIEESLVDRDVKDVRDIKVLDPACGSGHMLFYAFDVLYEMYLEQGDVAEKYIPSEILSNNLYGIDIDPGSAQLAALALYVKAKNVEPDVDVERINIVSADAVLVNGEKKKEVLSRTNSELERRVLEQVWTSFEHIREWGSLVRIDERIEEIIEEELEEVAATGQTKFTDDGLAKQSSVVSYSGGEESWEQVKDRLMAQVKELAEEALEHNDPIEEMFADEVEKSVQLLDVFLIDHDVVLSNPPYLGSRKMDKGLKEFIKDNYLASQDLYTAFIQRCTELSKDNGYVSMVTPENFMFQYADRKLREYIVSQKQLVEGVHLSRYGFDQAKDSYTIPFLLRNKSPESFDKSRFYRMTHKQSEYPDYNSKISGLKKITNSIRDSKSHEDVYIVDQKLFSDIGQSTYVYWLGPELLSLFDQYTVLEDITKLTSGLVTGDNDHHLRKSWEIPDEWVGNEYEWYVDSGDSIDYYDKIVKTVKWIDSGENIREYADIHGKKYQGLSGNQPYFESGVIFRDMSNEFTAKYLPSGCIYSKNVYHISMENKTPDKILLAYLNSNLYRFVINALNPGLHFNHSDVQSVFIKNEFDNESKMLEYIENYIQIRKNQFKHIEIAREFDPELLEPSGKSMRKFIFDSLHSQDVLSAEIYILHSLVNNLIYSEYNLSEEVKARIDQQLSTDATRLPRTLKTQSASFEYSSKVEHTGSTTVEDVTEDLNTLKEGSIQEVSESLGISPYSVVEEKYEENIYQKDREQEMAARLLSYYLGRLFGRWENTGGDIPQSNSEIIPFDEEFQLNVRQGIEECIAQSFGDRYEPISELEDILNKDCIDWLRNTFFRYHHCKEYRRRGQRIPIYWHVESDDGTFSCFMYYHSMDANSFPKLRGQYIDKKLDALQNRLEAIESELATAEGDHARKLRSEKEELQAEVKDISEFRDRVDALIDEGFEPDFEAGIWENIQKVDEHDLLAVPLDKL